MSQPRQRQHLKALLCQLSPRLHPRRQRNLQTGSVHVSHIFEFFYSRRHLFATSLLTHLLDTAAPIQPGMADNCDAFYFVKSSDTCDTIARANGVSITDLIKWNPAVGTGCTNMWADAYICISTLGVDVTAPITTTSPSNGVSTPVPTQEGMVANCNKFHLVQDGQTCATIAALNSISTSQFIAWNPAVNNGCSNLWASTVRNSHERLPRLRLYTC